MLHSTSAPGARIVADTISYATADGRTLFRDLTLSFGRERTGLVGPNGSGKTTLVRLLAGELSPTSGTVVRHARIAVLAQEPPVASGGTLAVVLGVADRLDALRRLDAGTARPDDVDLIGDDWDLPERMAAVLRRFGLEHLPPDRPLHSVSGGEGTRLALAGLTLRRPDFLLLDEPTNHLDGVSREALYAFVEQWTGGLLCVSHDRELLRRMDRIVELGQREVRVYGGNYDHFRERRDQEERAAEREMESARAAVRVAEREARAQRERQERRQAQGRRQRASGSLPRILLNARRSQAQTTAGQVRAITQREVEERRQRLAAARARVEERESPRIALASTQLPAGRTVLEMEDVSVRFPGSTRPVLEGISLRLTGPERVAITGPNGSGKTTLLRVATGALTPDSGTVRRLPDPEVAVLDQHGAGLREDLPVLENFRSRHPSMDETWARYVLARFLFADDEALRPVGTLSGGQRLRASLACVLGGEQPPSLLILDEPTNHLDLDALEALEDALLGYDGALLVVSHDETFLEAIGIERRIVLSEAHSTR